jgi:hypothetical protein
MLQQRWHKLCPAALEEKQTVKDSLEALALVEKERLRLRINAQVDEFLRSGGRINILSSEGSTHRANPGSAWQEQEELPQYTD